MLNVKNVMFKELVKVLEDRNTHDLILVKETSDTLELVHESVLLEVKINDDKFNFKIYNKEDHKEFMLEFNEVTKDELYEIDYYLFKCNVVSKVYDEVKHLENFKLDEDNSFSDDELSFTLTNKRVIVSLDYEDVECLIVKDLDDEDEREDYEDLHYSEVKSIILESIK